MLYEVLRSLALLLILLAVTYLAAWRVSSSLDNLYKEGKNDV